MIRAPLRRDVSHKLHFTKTKWGEAKSLHPEIIDQLLPVQDLVFGAEYDIGALSIRVSAPSALTAFLSSLFQKRLIQFFQRQL